MEQTALQTSSERLPANSGATTDRRKSKSAGSRMKEVKVGGERVGKLGDGGYRGIFAMWSQYWR